MTTEQHKALHALGMEKPALPQHLTLLQGHFLKCDQIKSMSCARNCRTPVINMLSLDTTQPDFAKKKLSKRQKRQLANLEASIMRSILGIEPL